jgi:hypothetical protein
VQSVRVAPFREDFTTDCTDDTDGKEKKKFWKQKLFIREIRGSIPFVAALPRCAFCAFSRQFSSPNL